MITVGMNYCVVDGRQSEFEDKFESVLGALRDSPGHVSSSLFRDVHDSSSYLIISEWQDERAFADFIQSAAFKRVTDWGKDQILKGRPRHRVYKH